MGFFISHNFLIFVVMVKDKLKLIIFKLLSEWLKDVEIIPYNGSVWFIDREKKYWYLELNPNNHLWWRYSFFFDFFGMFSLEFKEFEPLIREWAEGALNHKVSKSVIGYNGCRQLLERMLDCNIESSNHSEYNIDFISNYNILTTGGSNCSDKLIDNVLETTKIESSSFAKVTLTENIDIILNQPDV